MDGLNLELFTTMVRNELSKITKEHTNARGEELEPCLETDMERLKWVLEKIDEIKG